MTDDSYLPYLGGVLSAGAITGAAIATAVYVTARPSPMKTLLNMENQSEQIPGPENIRKSLLLKDDKFLGYLYEDAQTIYEAMLRGERVSNNGDCLAYRKKREDKYEWLSYKEVITKIRNFGSGLIKLGLNPGQTTFIGVYAQNSIEWVLAEHACYTYSMVIVSLYDTLGTHACTLIINEAEITTVVCDKEERVLSLLGEVAHTPTLKQIVLTEDVSEETRKKAKECNIELISFCDIEKLGASNYQEPIPPKPSDLATVCYTSGTTGSPKGVMLTHANIMADVCATMLQFGEVAPNGNDTMLSFLPLAHMFERCCEIGVYMVGGRVGFFLGNIRMLSDDMKTLKPTIIPCVPRLMNRIYDKVYEGVAKSKIKQFLLRSALNSKNAEVQQRIVRNNGFWDWLVFKPIRENMGGRIRLIVSGSAPLAGNVLSFLRSALGCVIVEGYGQTECVAPCTLTIAGDPTVGHVGPPLSCCNVKLVDVPEMEYYTKNNQGEVCVKGLNVFQGYLKDTEKTAAAVDSDGWLHTGDIGMWLTNGTLKILDRKKHIFKLSQGEYVVPEKIENIYIRSSFVAQIFIHGESLKSCLVGIIVPERSAVLSWFKKMKIPASGNWAEVCQSKDLKQFVLQDITSIGKKKGLKSFEQVKDIYLHSEPFTVDNGLLTPTLKTRRPQCRKHFMSQIEAMYRLLA